MASLQGSLIGITALVLARRRAIPDGDDNKLRHAKIPFGPFLSLAAMELMLFPNLLTVFFPYLY